MCRIRYCYRLHNWVLWCRILRCRILWCRILRCRILRCRILCLNQRNIVNYNSVLISNLTTYISQTDAEECLCVCLFCHYKFFSKLLIFTCKCYNSIICILIIAVLRVYRPSKSLSTLHYNSDFSING